MNLKTWQKTLPAALACLVFAFSAGAQTEPVALTPATAPMLPRASETLPPPGAVRLRSPDMSAVRRTVPLAQSTVVTSDDLVMDMEKKVATFTGHVKVVDPKGTMTADKMIVYLTQQDESGSGVRRIEASGGVVIAQEGSKAIGDDAIYSAVDQTVVLSGAAQVQTEQGIVTGETVIYDMAKGTAQVKGRPRLILPGKGGASQKTLFPAAPKPQAQQQPQAAPSQ
ncbi:MAG: LptA/OstA family protein [Verrucomicrobia bacterium]|nr:LptA/OstA family protein [Verrucomicrobiota bacterium]